jgi:beta-lactamase regulating signal transducer with metallopeptidase domain
MISSLPANGNGFSQLSPAIEALGWTLLHFVWQGAAIGLALACFLAVGRRTSASVRYLAGGSALALMTLSATGTFAWQMAALDTRPSLAVVAAIQPVPSESPLVGAPLEHSPAPDPPAALEVKGGQTKRASTTQFTPSRQSRSREMPNILIETTVNVGKSSDSPSDLTADVANSTAPPAPFTRIWSSREKVFEAAQPWLPWIVGLWTAGVALLALRLAVGWGMIRRLRRHGESPRDPVWSARLERLRVRLGVTAPVDLLCSAQAGVPMVIGWLKPVVLVPAGLLAGLTPHQLEAVLAHELAHIRRHDYLVNLLQNVVETFFFYHPAVWWVSRQIRTEREHCCDDLAAAFCGSTLDYARALTALAELRHTSGVFGLAATGGSLVNRIARLAGVGNAEPRLGWPFPLLVLTSAAAIGLFATNAATHSGEAAKPAAVKKLATQSFRGQVFDPAGKAVADAAVWLAGPNGRG